MNRRWYPLDPHSLQGALYWDDVRFKMCAAGRRSGKTELAKRKGISRAYDTDRDNYWGVFAAPTRDQAKRIFWDDMKMLIPRNDRLKTNESDLSIMLRHNGATLQAMGMDKPERIEGSILDWIGLDEFGNMKPECWFEHVRPALSTRGRLGEAWFFGVPEGRNHYWDLWIDAQRQPDWKTYTWFSSDILDEEEIISAKRMLDPRSYAQEYEGSFLDFEGRVYYCFNRDVNCKPLRYFPEYPLVFCFDFNSSPGVAIICQEIGGSTHVIGEIWKENDSNTEIICTRLGMAWGKEGANHQGRIDLYGDATGGAKGSQSVMGSDWAIIRQQLYKFFPMDNIHFMQSTTNPRVRVRTNTVNSRLRSADGVVSAYIDPEAAPHLVKDLEGVTKDDLDKKDGPLTHISDAFGYYLADRWPIEEHSTALVEI